MTPGQSMAALRLRGLSKRFGDTVAVRGIDLDIPRGSFYGLVGPNGAGKTTTLSMATGLLRPDHGTSHVLGVDVWAAPVRAKAMTGILPDGLRVFDRLTGLQLITYVVERPRAAQPSLEPLEARPEARLEPGARQDRCTK